MQRHRGAGKESAGRRAQPDQEDSFGEHTMSIGIILVGLALILLVLVPFLMT
jgi:hypothetical protein